MLGILLFIPGTQQQCPVIGNNARKYRIGVEICLDHALGMLKNRRVPNLHFHFVISDYTATKDHHMAMARGGYFFHASSKYEHSNIKWRDDQGGVIDLTTDQRYWKHTEPMGPNHLDAYILPLPKGVRPPPGSPR